MARMNQIKLSALKKTKDFYLWKLKRKDSLTENERFKYQVALELIRNIIKEKRKAGENETISR